MNLYARTKWLAHHGIKGQKWGVRRYQNPDGTYTNLGKERRQDHSDSSRGFSKKKALEGFNKVKALDEKYGSWNELFNEYSKNSPNRKDFKKKYIFDNIVHKKFLQAINEHENSEVGRDLSEYDRAERQFADETMSAIGPFRLDYDVPAKLKTVNIMREGYTKKADLLYDQYVDAPTDEKKKEKYKELQNLCKEYARKAAPYYLDELGLEKSSKNIDYIVSTLIGFDD